MYILKNKENITFPDFPTSQYNPHLKHSHSTLTYSNVFIPSSSPEYLHHGKPLPSAKYGASKTISSE